MGFYLFLLSTSGSTDTERINFTHKQNKIKKRNENKLQCRHIRQYQPLQKKKKKNNNFSPENKVPKNQQKLKINRSQKRYKKRYMYDVQYTVPFFIIKFF